MAIAKKGVNIPIHPAWIKYLSAWLPDANPLPAWEPNITLATIIRLLTGTIDPFVSLFFM